jgi:hypothetical protein
VTIHDPGRLLLLLVALLGAIFLRSINTINDTVLIGIVGPVIGYLTGSGNGNGNITVQRDPGPRPDDPPDPGVKP